MSPQRFFKNGTDVEATNSAGWSELVTEPNQADLLLKQKHPHFPQDLNKTQSLKTQHPSVHNTIQVTQPVKKQGKSQLVWVKTIKTNQGQDDTDVRHT